MIENRMRDIELWF